MNISSNRIIGLDIIKCFAAFLIVVLHWPVDNVYGQAVHMAARPGVPLFFMITGYFLNGTITKGGQWRYLKKIMILTVYAYTLYTGIHLMKYGVMMPSWESIGVWLLTGKNAVGGHLWYLNTLILAVLVIVGLTKITSLQKLHWLIPILFIGNYIISCFDVPAYYYRNALFTGIPYILLGDWIRTNIAKWSWTSRRYLSMVAMSFGLLFCEVMAYRMGGANEHREHFMMLIPISIFVFAWGVRYEQKNPNKTIDVISKIGRDCSQYIYVYHYAILGALYPITKGIMQPVCVILLSLLVSYLHIKIKRKIA